MSIAGESVVRDNDRDVTGELVCVGAVHVNDAAEVAVHTKDAGQLTQHKGHEAPHRSVAVELVVGYGILEVEVEMARLALANDLLHVATSRLRLNDPVHKVLCMRMRARTS